VSDDTLLAAAFDEVGAKTSDPLIRWHRDEADKKCVPARTLFMRKQSLCIFSIRVFKGYKYVG
jgi:hypothetical protein